MSDYGYNGESRLSSEHYSLSDNRARYPGSVGKRDLTEAQATRVLARLRARLERDHEGNVLSMARALGVSQSGLWKLLHDRASPSLATAEALAQADGVTVETVLTGARELAAKVTREGGVPEGAIKRVLSEPDEEHTVLYWIDRIRAVALLEGASGESRPSPTRIKRGAA